MGRSPCCEKVGLKKGPWTPEEDKKLMAHIEEHGHGSWRALPAKAGLQRCGKSCRLRWTNYLRPDIKRGKFSLQEEQSIIQLHALLGNRWSAIAAQLPKRTDNEIKNYWNTHLKKRLAKMGIDPTTHKPKIDALGGCRTKDVANLSHMAQWESARLEAEVRLVRESKLQLGSCSSNIQPASLVLNKIVAQQPSIPPCLDVLKAWQSSWLKPQQQITSPTTTAKPNNNDNKMYQHSMYAMMLCTDHDSLESPTSTLNFPGTMLPISTTTVAVLNENLLPLTTTTKTNPTSMEEGESWRYLNLTKQNNNTIEEELLGENKIMMESNTMSNLQDDDIMVAVEAFRTSSGYDNIVVPTVLSENTTTNVAMEGLSSNDAMAYDSNNNNILGAEHEENMAIINGYGSIYNVNLEENNNNNNNKYYWNNILNLVNDSVAGSSVF